MTRRTTLASATLVPVVGAAAGALLLRRRADLSGQVAVVAGGSRGLGLLLARELVAAGCRVAICARDADTLDRARADLESRGGEVLALTCDVSDQAQADEFIQAVIGRFGGVDVLVNVAGIIQVGPVTTMGVADFERAMGVMFWGPFYLIRAALPSMRARGCGRIVNITSIGGKISVPHLLPYSCAKFAAVALSEGLRAELAGSGIKVTTVVPGLMRTGSHLNALFTGQQKYEFGWFAVGASAPLISMDAERAARRIVNAARAGQAELILTPQAQLAVRFHGVAPGTTAILMRLFDRLLPDAPASDGAMVQGIDARRGIDAPWFRRLTGWGVEAARRLNQLPADDRT